MPELIPLSEALKLMSIPRSTYYYNRDLPGYYPKEIYRSPRRIVMRKEDVLKWIEQGGPDNASN